MDLWAEARIWQCAVFPTQVVGSGTARHCSIWGRLRARLVTTDADAWKNCYERSTRPPVLVCRLISHISRLNYPLLSPSALDIRIMTSRQRHFPLTVIVILSALITFRPILSRVILPMQMLQNMVFTTGNTIFPCSIKEDDFYPCQSWIFHVLFGEIIVTKSATFLYYFNVLEVIMYVVVKLYGACCEGSVY